MEPEIFRFVLQHLNHCATGVPKLLIVVYLKLSFLYCKQHPSEPTFLGPVFLKTSFPYPRNALVAVIVSTSVLDHLQCSAAD